MKGIILAGGSGSRLYPLTKAVSKQILPVYDKPMIYYPLSCLMLAKIKEILIISTPHDIKLFKSLFNDGSRLGMKFSYAIQESPRGLADAFIIGRDFIGNDDAALILGDNIFYGQNFTQKLNDARLKIETGKSGAVIFACMSKDPSAYGVIGFDDDGNVSEIEEKPEKPKSDYAVSGLYFFDNSVIKKAACIKPSARGELEITDINNSYLKEKKLSVEILGRGMAWFDTGTFDRLNDASNFIATVQKRQGLYVGCIEEIAFTNGWIGKDELISLSDSYKNEYGEYMRYIAKKDEKKCSNSKNA